MIETTNADTFSTMTSLSVSEALQLSKRQFADRAESGAVPQTGVEVLTSDFCSDPVQGLDVPQEPMIDTFMIDTTSRSIIPLGTDSDLNTHWLPQVAKLADIVLDWLQASDVGVEAQAYATASITAAGDVNEDPHFDDGMFEPDAGVGAVAVVGDCDGPRVATTPLPGCDVRPNTLIEVTDEQKDAFRDGSIGRVELAGGSVALFPQFAQLHSGPGPVTGASVRQLLVLRVGTVPTAP